MAPLNVSELIFDAPGAAGNFQQVYDWIFLDLFHQFNRDNIPKVNLTGKQLNWRASHECR